ncbi:2-methylisocitrate lyase [Pedobacter yonginense]|uniref:2-methylisocitrate lyase n=1 Tax=Pedobacter yonginense TaxID=651869 RepID=A0A317EQG5_9SPHI|nr:paraquat-inducible protein A [Pedobacter yonginense]PWS28615.1 2-methylisocitrate lyase [Pedobacter yonginense]
MTTQQPDTQAKKSGLSNIILIIGLSILLCGEAYYGYRLRQNSIEKEQIKEDYSMVNNITFGLFSVNQWRDKISEVVNRQVTDFKMTAKQKKELQKEVENQLHGLVSKTFAQINKPQKSLKGKLTKFAVKQFVDPKKIQAQVPSFAKTIITKINSPASTKRLKSIATSKLNQLEQETYDSTEVANDAVIKYISKKYHVADPVEFNDRINTRLAFINKATYNSSLAMLACVVVALGLWLIMRKHVRLHTTLFVMSLLFAFVLLVVGTTAPIIEVDARIHALNFSILGEKIAFENQVLFYQSKSIIGIIEVLIKQPKPDSVVIGALLLLFVIILPILRLTAKGIHILANDRIRKNGVLRYLAFESGKWDMADVMVVGILMTYIGLNGILKSQLSNLEIHNDVLNTMTENNTALQPGYFVFVGYVVYAIILSVILKRITPNDTII